MYQITYKPSCCKITLGIVIVCCYIIALKFFLSYYITYYNIATVILTIVSLLAIIRAVGIFSMYPGSFRYIAAQIEKRENDHLLGCIHKHMNTIIKISNELLYENLSELKRNHTVLLAQQIMQSLDSELNILRKSENPSQKKLLLINTYENLINQLNFDVKIDEKYFIIEEQEQTKNEKTTNTYISLAQIMKNSSLLLKIASQQTFEELKTVAKHCVELSKQIWSYIEDICYIVKPIIQEQSNFVSNITVESLNQQIQTIEVHKFQIAKWHMFEQKLFTMNSYFALWDKYFVYETFMIPIGALNHIQCAIIYGEKLNQDDDNEQKQDLFDNSRPGVLFSNPNGMFLQTTGLASSYMKFYLKWGFRIVLWNYRGYGKSTGVASISKCISDARKVYQYVKIKYKIKIEVLHGYSIGGVCAINLAHDLNKNPNQPIKLLIADRTFSSVDKVAQGFIKQNNILTRFIKTISSPLIKFLFRTDCIDNAKRFIECQCQKICIWDTIDIIINKKASLKYTLIRHAKNWSKFHKKNKQRSGDLEGSKQLLNFCQQFSGSSLSLYQTNRTIYEKIMKILYDTDGAGEIIFLPLKLKVNEESAQQKVNQTHIIKKFQRYFIGLCIYGPKLSGTLLKQEAYVKQMEQRLEKRMQMIQKQKIKLKIYEQASEKCSVLIDSILSCLNYAKAQLSYPIYLKNKKKYGNLIVSQVGHNCDLKEQYFYLQQAVKANIKNIKINPQLNSSTENKSILSKVLKKMQEKDET